MARLNCNDPEIEAALDDVFDANSDTNWAYFGYVPKTTKIKLVAKGDDGFEEMLDELNDGKTQFFYICFKSFSVRKFVYIPFCGEGVTGMMKGNFSNHCTDMYNFIRRKHTIHVQILARSEEDIDEDVIKSKLKMAIGANYDAGARKQGVSGGVKSVNEGKNFHTKAQEVKQFSRDPGATYVDQNASTSFWQKNQQEKSAPVKTAGNTIVDKDASQKYWDQNQTESQAVKSTDKPAEVMASTQGAGNLASRFEQKAQEQAASIPKPNPSPRKKWTPPPASNPPPVVNRTPPPAASNPPPVVNRTPPPVASNPPPAVSTPPPAVTSAPPPRPAGSPPAVSTPPPAVSAPPPVTSAPPPRPVGAPPVSAPAPTPAPAQEEYGEEYAEEEYGEEEYAEEYAEEEYGEEEYAEEEYGEEEYAEEYAEEEYGEEEYAEEEYAEEEYGEEEYYEGGYIGQAKALFEYSAEREEDLSFAEGDIINIMDNTDPSGWWQGELNGVTGYFPSNFVEAM